MMFSKHSLSLKLLVLTLLAPVHTALADNADWMRWLEDSTSLAALSIPGTHDTMANQADSASFFELPWVLTQTQELRPQLDWGIRALDIRARHIGDRFALHHGAYYLQANFDDVLSTTVQFLKDHPGETILMRVQQEHTEEFCTRSFIDTFRWYRDQPAYSPFIWRGTTIPTLGAVRGKIVILDGFSSGAHGINWGSLDIQDAWEESNTDAKWNLVRNHLNAADEGPRDRMYVNFMSASNVMNGNCADPFPMYGTPRCIATRLNAEAHNYLVDGDGQRTGLLMADFPQLWLPEAIIPLNAQSGIPSSRSENGQYQSGTTLEYGIDRPGLDYMVFALRESRPELCRSACFADAPRCKAFSYVAPGIQGLQAMCYLKSGISVPQLSAHNVAGTAMTQPKMGLFSGLVETNVDRPGMNYRSFVMKEARPELCREACRTESNRCKSFTYMRPGRKSAEPMCVLKSGVPAPVPDPESDSGVNPSTTRQYTTVGTSLELDIDRGGQDYRTFEMQDARPEVCREACFNESNRCKSFTYVKPGFQGPNARCYLKSGIPSPTLNSNAISGTTLSNRNTGLVSGWIETNVDRGGQDYRNFELQEARPESCREACIAEAPHCKAFTYVKPGFNGYPARCYLKSGVPAPMPSAGCDSGVIDKP